MTGSPGHSPAGVEISFGQILRKLRESAALSQEQLAFRSGHHRTYISLLERGLRSPSLQAIVKISAALEISPDEIVRLSVQRLHSTSDSS